MDRTIEALNEGANPYPPGVRQIVNHIKHDERFIMNDTSIAWLGLDAHSKNCVLGQLDDHGQEIQSWSFATQPQKLIQHLQAIPATRQGSDARKIQPRPLAQPAPQAAGPTARRL